MGKAVNTCADNLGYFNPPNVYRPAIIDIRIVGEYSAEDGATNTYRITQNDGKIFEFDVKNGSGGSAGRSVTSVEQIQISTESLGKNIARITLSDGTYTDVEIRNGAQGQVGPQGERGPAGIDSVEASIGTNDPTQAPSVDKDLTEGVLSLTFNNIKGQKGDKGDQGNSGFQGDYTDLEIVNGLEETTVGKALDATQGKALDSKISQLGQKLTELQQNVGEALITHTFSGAIEYYFPIKVEKGKYAFLTVSGTSSKVHTYVKKEDGTTLYDRNIAADCPFLLFDKDYEIGKLYFYTGDSTISFSITVLFEGDLNNKTILLKAFGTSFIGVEKVGDFAYNSSSKLLRICAYYNTDGDNSFYVTYPFIEGAFYQWNNKIYVYNGTELVESPKTDKDEYPEIGSQHLISSNGVALTKLVNIDYFYSSSASAPTPTAGKTIFNISTKKLLIVVDSNHWNEISLRKDVIYTFAQKINFYWNGEDLVLSKQLITLFSITGQYSLVSGQGDLYLTSSNVLRLCNVYISSSPSDSKFIDFSFVGAEDSVYQYGDDFYLFKGSSGLVPISPESGFLQFYEASYVSGYFIRSTQSGSNPVGKYMYTGDSHYYADPTFYPVKKGQTIKTNLYSFNSWNCIVAFYTKANENYCEYAITNNTNSEKVITFAKDGFVRFAHQDTYTPIEMVYVFTSIRADFGSKMFFSPNRENYAADEKETIFRPSSCRIDNTYKGQVDSKKRYLAIGFDDFRSSDFTMVQPLFEKYRGRATFNMIIRASDIPSATNALKEKFYNTVYGGHEVGDHTIMHLQFNVNDPLFDGSTFPTNDQMRLERSAGGGRNVFARLLTESVSDYLPIAINTAWGDLSDAECQQIRDKFAIIKNADVLAVYDALSNKYLGTSGSSSDPTSWDGEKFTKGIFTGCTTSANHEIWERIMQVKAMYFKEQFGMNYDFKTWCLPGNIRSRLYFYDTVTQLFYYDAEMTKLANDTAKFTSSLTGKERSLVDIWREFGYEGCHGNIWPSKQDGQHLVAMSENLFFNEKLSRQDAILYPTSLDIVDYLSPSVNYPESFFSGNKKRETQMYDDDTVTSRPFRTYIEYIRNITARHGVAGGVFDSVDDYSSRMFFEGILKFCKSQGIEVISKAEAYDICFNHNIEDGNLLGNPDLVNTAAEFFTDSEDVPTNPDGYIGNCYVQKDANNIPVLHTTGDVIYDLFGIPCGNLTFSAIVSGMGTITIQAVKNNTKSSVSGGIQTFDSSDLEDLATINISNASEQSIEQDVFVKDNDRSAYEQLCEGYGNKIMALHFVYSEGLEVSNLKLIKK